MPTHSVLNRADFAALAAKRSDLAGRVASRDTDPTLTTVLTFLPNPDPILRKLGRRDEVFRAIAYDSHVAGELVSMASAVKSRRYRVLPGADDPPSQRAYQICQAFLRRRPDPIDQAPRAWSDVLWEMYLSRLWGYSTHELAEWSLDPAVGAQVPRVLEVPQRRVVFDAEGSPRLLTRANPSKGDPMSHPRRWIVTRHLADADNPYGFALFSAAFWPKAFKQNGMRWFARFVEKYGVGKLVAKVPVGTTDKQKDAIAGELAAAIEDSVAVITGDGSVDLVLPPAGSDQLHTRFIEQCNKELSKALRSNTLSIEAQGDGSLAATEAHGAREQRIDLGNLSDIKESMDLLFQWVTEVNVANATPPRFEWEESASISKELVDALDKARGLVDVTVEFGYELLRIPQPKPGQAVIPRATTAAPVLPAEFSQYRPGGHFPSCPHCAADFAASGNPSDPVDVILERLGVEGEAHIDAMYQRILKEFEASADMAEAQQRVLDLYPDLDTSDYARLLGNAFMVCELRGRVAVDGG